VEQPASHNRADNTQHDVEKKAFTGLIYDFTADEPGNQTENQPKPEMTCALL
jgi:hypothetical protein